MANSFIQRELRVTLILAGTNQVFPGTNSNTLVLTNLRMSAQVQAVNRLASQAALRIYGMTLEAMSAVSIAWSQPPIVFDHLLILEARSNDGTLGPDADWTTVFRGTILEAQPDFSGAPDVFFTVLAKTGYHFQINPAEPTAYQEATNINIVAGALAKQMGFAFENAGANAVLDGPLYLHGTLYDQLATACRMAKADFYVLGSRVLVTPQGQPFKNEPSVVLTKDTGMQGYPMFERTGLKVSALYDPAFQCGVAIEVRSIVPNAAGRWYPYALTHALESRLPNGTWSTQMICNKVFV